MSLILHLVVKDHPSIGKEVTAPADLIDTYTETTFTNPPLEYSGFGVAEHTDPTKATAFFMRGTDSKMVSEPIHLVVVGLDRLFTQTRPFLGLPVLRLSMGLWLPLHLRHQHLSHYALQFNGGTWISQPMPDRFIQKSLNNQWFDAEPLGSNWLVTYCNNGTQMATIFDGTAFADPWPIFGLDPEFGAAQTRICKLTTVEARSSEQHGHALPMVLTSTMYPTIIWFGQRMAITGPFLNMATLGKPQAVASCTRLTTTPISSALASAM